MKCDYIINAKPKETCLKDAEFVIAVLQTPQAAREIRTCTTHFVELCHEVSENKNAKEILLNK